MQRLVVLAVAAALLAAACSSPKPASPATPSRSSVPAGPQTFTVSVDGKSPSYNLAADAYFPSALKVHPGDAIQFKEVWSGEPHTVTFGTLVDRSAAAPPSIFPKGRGDAVQSAAQPCFLDTGAPPVNAACPKVPQPPFSGLQTFYNSGWLADGSTFSMAMSATIGPGTYTFRCLVHPGMSGEVDVVASGQAIPGPAEVTAAGAAQLALAVQAQIPPVPVPRAQAVNGGSYGGTGFHNSGVLASLPPGLLTYTLQFNAPGVYTVRCLIHPAMTQTVKVS